MSYLPYSTVRDVNTGFKQVKDIKILTVTNYLIVFDYDGSLPAAKFQVKTVHFSFVQVLLLRFANNGDGTNAEKDAAIIPSHKLGLFDKNELLSHTTIVYKSKTTGRILTRRHDTLELVIVYLIIMYVCLTFHSGRGEHTQQQYFYTETGSRGVFDSTLSLYQYKHYFVKPIPTAAEQYK